MHRCKHWGGCAAGHAESASIVAEPLLPAVLQVREYLDGYGHPYDIVGGNHDLEGIDEFATDEENLEAYLRIMGECTIGHTRLSEARLLLWCLRC